MFREPVSLSTRECSYDAGCAEMPEVAGVSGMMVVVIQDTLLTLCVPELGTIAYYISRP